MCVKKQTASFRHPGVEFESFKSVIDGGDDPRRSPRVESKGLRAELGQVV